MPALTSDIDGDEDNLLGETDSGRISVRINRHCCSDVYAYDDDMPALTSDIDGDEVNILNETKSVGTMVCLRIAQTNILWIL